MEDKSERITEFVQHCELILNRLKNNSFLPFFSIFFKFLYTRASIITQNLIRISKSTITILLLSISLIVFFKILFAFVQAKRTTHVTHPRGIFSLINIFVYHRKLSGSNGTFIRFSRADDFAPSSRIEERGGAPPFPLRSLFLRGV